jgi:hypothetical protein
MARVRRDFEKEEAKLRKGLDGEERWKAVSFLHALEEEWARALVGAKPDGSLKTAMKAAAKPKLDPSLALEAAKHLVNAEKWARDYASYATSGAEGSVAMGYVREIQFAHAWMLVTASTNAKLRARALCKGLEGRRENLDAYERRELDKLKPHLK